MPSYPRSTRLLVPLIAVALLIPPVGAAFATSTTAAPSAGSLREIGQQITITKAALAGLDNQAEIAAERFNAGRIALAAAQRVATQRGLAAAGAAQRVAAARRQIDAIAADAYMTGGTSDTAMSAQLTDPGQFTDRQAITEEISRQQSLTLAGMRAAQQDQLTTARAAVQATAAQQAVLDSLSVDRSAVTRAQTLALSTLHQLQVEQAALVAQAQIEEARAAAAAAAATSAAQRAVAARARITAHREAVAAQTQAETLARQATARRAALAQKPPEPTSPAPTPTPPPPPADATSPTTAPTAPVATPQPRSTPSAPTKPATSQATPATGTVGGAPAPSGAASGAAATAVSWARQELGKPYQWAAAGPDRFDCSGLTLFVYAKAGISLGHYTGDQFTAGRHVPRTDLQPGDLVFFGSPIHHVGIYIGGGQMIHAPQTGDVVRIASIDSPDYAGAVRVAG